MCNQPLCRVTPTASSPGSLHVLMHSSTLLVLPPELHAPPKHVVECDDNQQTCNQKRRFRARIALCLEANTPGSCEAAQGLGGAGHAPKSRGTASAPASSVSVLYFFSSCRYLAAALTWAGSLEAQHVSDRSSCAACNEHG